MPQGECDYACVLLAQPDFFKSVAIIFLCNASCKGCLCIIQMLISLFPYLAAIQTWLCNAYTKYLLFQVCVTVAPHLSSDLSIKIDQPMARQKREKG